MLKILKDRFPIWRRPRVIKPRDYFAGGIIRFENMEKLPGQLGFLILNEDGAVVNSGGELENDEQVAEILFRLVSVGRKDNLVKPGTVANFHRMSVHYGTHIYSIALSNKKFHIVKRKYQLNEPVLA